MHSARLPGAHLRRAAALRQHLGRVCLAQHLLEAAAYHVVVRDAQPLF
jgi:hypothetical protein